VGQYYGGTGTPSSFEDIQKTKMEKRNSEWKKKKKEKGKKPYRILKKKTQKGIPCHLEKESMRRWGASSCKSRGRATRLAEERPADLARRKGGRAGGKIRRDIQAQKRRKTNRDRSNSNCERVSTSLWAPMKNKREKEV